MPALSVRRALLSGGGNPIPLTLTSGSALEPLYSFGWTAGTFGGLPSGYALTLTNSAGGQFSIGGNMLRLEKALGAVGTVYTITVQATAPGYKTTTAIFALTVTNTYGSGLVERINALNTSLLWQDTGRTTPVTADNQTVAALNGTIAGWQASSATGPKYRTNIQGGRAALQFTGTQFLNFTTAAAINFFGSSWLNTPWTMVAVIQSADTTARDLLTWSNGTNIYLLWRTSAGNGMTFSMGSGGSTTTDGSNATFTANTSHIVSLSSDGSPDLLHLGFNQDGVYAYGTATSNPMAQVTSTSTGGTMVPTAATIGGRTPVSGGTKWNGYVFDLLFYNRTIGSDELRYIHQELAAEWGITISPPAPSYLDVSSWPLWFSDDFDGSAVSWTPTQGLSQSPTLGSDGNPTGWVPAYWQGTTPKTYNGSTGANSSEVQYMPDPRSPIWAANGAGSVYTVANSVLTIQSQATPAALNINASFNITATNATGNVVTTNANFGSLGIAVGMPVTTGSSGSFGGLSASTTYYVATIINPGANSTCTLSTTPPYIATNTVTVTTASGTFASTCKPAGGMAYLGGALISQGWKARTFGILSVRVRHISIASGNWPASWVMPATGDWTGEIDFDEGFSNTSSQTEFQTLHSVPYPTVCSQNTALGIRENRVNQADGFHVLSVKWDENGTEFFVDGVSVGATPPYSGIRNVTITNPGSGLTNGTYNLYAASAGSVYSAPQLTLTVSGNTVTGWSIVTSGSGLTGQPTWYTNSGLTTPLSTTLPGVALTVDYSGDPAIPMYYYEPFYLLHNLALGGAAGTFTPAKGYHNYQIDYVRWYKKVYPVPAKMTPGFDPAFDAQVAAAVSAIVAAYASAGATMTAGDQAALSLFVRTLMAYEVRKDTTPPTGIASDWTVANLSIWSALDMLYVPGLAYNYPSAGKACAKINLKNPGTNDLSEVGAGITWTQTRGLVLPGTGGVYLDSGQAPIQFTNQDACLSFFLPAAPTNGANAALAGYNAAGSWRAYSGGSDPRPGITTTASSVVTLQRPLTGYVAMSRGYKAGVHMWQNGEYLWAGYSSGAGKLGERPSITGNFKIGSYDGSTAGAAFSFLECSPGRRRSQAEHEIYNTALRTLFASLGLTVNV